MEAKKYYDKKILNIKVYLIISNHEKNYKRK